MISRMLRLELVCLKEAFDEALGFLHEAGVLHVEPAEMPPALEGRLARVRLSDEDDRRRSALEGVVEESGKLLRASAPAPGQALVELEALSTDVLVQRFEALKEKLRRAESRSTALQHELDLLPHYERLVDAFFSVKYAFERRADWAMVGLVLDRRWEEDLGTLREEIARVTRGRSEISVATLDANRLVAILFYDRRFEKDLDALVWSKGVDRLPLPDSYLGRPLEDVLADIAARRRELPRLLGDAARECEDLLRATSPELSALHKLARERIMEINIRTAFLQSQFTVAVNGWVPEESAPSLEKTLRERFGGKVFVRLRPPRPEERALVPIAFKNRPAARPFEILLQPLSPPRYGSLDPTPLLALFFPIFFGLIVGDIGHGLILVAAGLTLRRFVGRARAVSHILVTLGGSAVVFGLLFGEFFGDLGKGWLRPLLFHRTENMVLLLLLTLALGVVHVFLGLVLGIVQSLKLRERRHAVEKGATVGILFAGLLLLGTLSRLLPQSLFTPGLVLLLVLVPVLIYVGGLIAMIELISSAGNILSYARLMALGLAGVMLAQVANSLGTRMGNVVLGVLVAVLLHLLNVVMSTFSPGVQALRLHYVEFFSKFYEPGGVPYAPFRRGER